MKIRKRIWAFLLSVCLMLPVFAMETQAASGSISIGSASGKVGETVTVTCTIKCGSGPIGTADVVLKYDSAGLKYVDGSGGYSLTGGSGSVSYSGLTSAGTETSLSFTMKFKIKKEGSFEISSTSAVVYNLDEELLTVSNGSGKITGKAESSSSGGSGNSGSGSGSSSGNSSGSGSGSSGNSGSAAEEDKRDTNNKLSSLDVYPGSLSPAFSADKTSYKVEVSGEVTEVTITAEAQSSKAEVRVSGGKDLKLGENSAKVVVTAENDSTKVYNITIVCGEVEKITVDGKEHTIYESFEEDEIPTGFERTEVTYNGRKYEGLQNEDGTLVLMGLQNSEENKFYFYDQTSQEFQPFAQVKISKGNYIYPAVLDETNEEFAEHEKIAVQIKGSEFEAWKLDDEFCVLTVLRGNGEQDFYRYDRVEGTFQRYVATEEIKEVIEEPIVDEEPTIPTKYYVYIIIGLGALVVILLAALIFFIATRRIRHKARKTRAQRKAEKKAIEAEAGKILESMNSIEEK